MLPVMASPPVLINFRLFRSITKILREPNSDCKLSDYLVIATDRYRENC